MAPATSRPVDGLQGTARVPGDKSISHRALMLASQVLGTTRIQGLLEGEDVLATAEALKKLGVSVRRHAAGDWEVEGVGTGGLHAPRQVLDMGNAGTGARLLMGLLASYPFQSVFTGDASLCSRPMQRIITPLSEIGAQFMARDGKYLPLAMQGAREPLPISYRLPVASAQVKSAILLAGLNCPGTTSVIEPRATRDHTERMLTYLGIPVTHTTNAEGERMITVTGQQAPSYTERLLHIPADPSSAAFALVAAVITPNSDVTLEDICINTSRIGIITTLREMGANITLLDEREVCGEPVADIRVRSGRLSGVEVPAERAPSMIDEYPVLAVAAAFAEGSTVMHGVEELRIKESDRLQAILDGLGACGVKAEAAGDTLSVHGTGGKPEGGGQVTTQYDHRIAMSFLVLGMGAKKPVTVDDARAIATSFPDFSLLMNELGADIHVELPPRRTRRKEDRPGQRVIAIDGPAGSGKGTLARRLARHYGYAYLDTGSLYRAVAMKLLEAGQDPQDTEAALEAIGKLAEHELNDPNLRLENVGKAASIISAIPEVRTALLDYQRDFSARPEGAVLDGRDIGTVVCPDARIKLFLTASLEARARRRHEQLQDQGIEVVYESVLSDLQERDTRDSQRQSAPLAAAKDAVRLDTTDMNADEVFTRTLELTG